VIGLLDAYQFEKTGYQTLYEPMMREFLKAALPGVEVKTFKVGLGEKPKPQDADGWILSGSPKSAYDKDEWILDLQKFIKSTFEKEIKLAGVCFGHQLIAHSLGGKAEKSKNGWGVGVREFSIIDQAPWMNPSIKKCSLIFSHQDQVSQLPTGAKLLAEDAFCPIQMYSVGHHVFSFQGHPEFTPEFAQMRLDSRKALIGEETYSTASKNLHNKTNRSEIGQWLRHFFS
jgi:GMP synthase-like glutamine amidotransferase